MSQTANRIVKNTGYLYARLGVSMFISLWTTRLILNSLGSSDFGVYAIIGGAIGLLEFFNAALTSSTQRFMSFAEGEGDNGIKSDVFNVSVGLHIIIGIVTASILILAGFFFLNGILNIPTERLAAAKVIYVCFIFSVFTKMLGVPYEASLNAHENMRIFASIGILESILKLIIAFICVYTLSDKLIIYGSLMAILPLITLCMTAGYCSRNYKECKLVFVKFKNVPLIKKMATFAGWKLLDLIATFVTINGVSVLLNIFGGVAINAAHGIANQLQGQLLAFTTSMQKALNPVLVKSQGAGKNEMMLAAATTGNKLSFFLFALFAMPMMVEAPFILGIWLGNVPEWTVLFTRLLLIRTLLWQMSVAYETCIAANGEIKIFTVISSVIYVTPLVVSFIVYKNGAPIYSIYILLIIMVICRSSNILYYCRRLCGLKIKESLRELFFPCVFLSFLSLIFIYWLHILMTESILRLITVVLSSSIILSISCFYILFNKEERLIAIETIKIIRARYLYNHD